MIEILGKTSIDFIKRRNYAFVFSGILVFIGLLTVVQLFRGHANLGIDFAGGTAVQLQFEAPVELGDARKLLSATGFPDAELQEFTRDNTSF